MAGAEAVVETARAAAVVDDEHLPERGLDVRREHAREDVGGAAGGERHDDANGLVRVGL